MLADSQMSHTLVENSMRMQRDTSQKSLAQEWQQIQKAQLDPTAFKPLYDRYFEPIFKFVFRRTGDRSLSDDLCSQIFLKAMENLDRYEYKGVPFSSWLFRIASNEVSQHYRKIQKNRVVSVEDYSLTSMIDEIEEQDTEQYKRALLNALEHLKEQDMQLIELRFFEQRPFKEVAEIMQISESNAKVRIYRILQRLRKKLQAKM